MSYICVLLYCQPSTASIPHQHTSVCFLCFIFPFFSISMTKWRSASLVRICIISRFFSLPPLCQISAMLWGGGRGGGVFILLQLSIQMLWHHNFPPIIFFMIIGPFSATPPIIVHGIHIITSHISLPHRNMKFIGIDNRLGEVMSPVQAEASKRYQDPNIDVREQGESAGKYLDREQYEVFFTMMVFRHRWVELRAGEQVYETRGRGRSVESVPIVLTTIFGLFKSDVCPGASV